MPATIKWWDKISTHFSKCNFVNKMGEIRNEMDEHKKIHKLRSNK
jgi:hypothetical protein